MSYFSGLNILLVSFCGTKSETKGLDPGSLDEIRALLCLDPVQSLILLLKLFQMVEWRVEKRRPTTLRFQSPWRATESSPCLQSLALEELLREGR